MLTVFIAVEKSKSFSEEMNTSLSIHLARLESENKDLSTLLKNTEQRLTSSNHKREQQYEHNESMYKKRVGELEAQVRDIRQRMSRELSGDFAMKVGNGNVLNYKFDLHLMFFSHIVFYCFSRFL